MLVAIPLLRGAALVGKWEAGCSWGCLHGGSTGSRNWGAALLFDLFGLTPLSAFLSSLCMENTQDKPGFGLGWGLCEGSMRLPKP